MWGVPNSLECSHGLDGGGNLLLNIIIVAQAKGDEGTKILEVATEGDVSIFNLYGLGLVKLVV
jgi:hypothetical protein